MTKFRVISEPFRLDRFSPTIPTHRRMRGDRSVQRKVTVVEADTVFEALSRAVELGDHRKHSITSIEEMFPVEALSVTDEQLTAALRRTGRFEDPDQCASVLDPDDFEGETLYESPNFNDTVESVAEVLGDTLLPGLYLTVASDMDGASGIVEIRDEATGQYRAETSDMRRLIEDRSATGWDGVLSIAKALIAAAGPLA
jgi:hypothetical protein